MKRTQFPTAQGLPRSPEQMQSDAVQGTQAPVLYTPARPQRPVELGRAPRTSGSEPSSSRRHAVLPGRESANLGTSPGRSAQSSSTVSRLASDFSASELISAAIQVHNRQDFTGAALPSGASVDSHALSNTM